MSTKIAMTIDGKRFNGELNDSPTGRHVLGMLPLRFTMSRWGDEYYGSIGRGFDLEEDARDVLDIGELAYWPPGSALCLFFGPTPASVAEEPRAASEVNPIGTIDGELSVLKGMGSAVEVTLEKA